MSKQPIGQRVAFEYGYGVRVDSELIGSYPVYGSNGPTGYIDSFKVSGPGVIIGRKGSVGKVAYSSQNFTPTDTSYYLRILDKSKDDMKFWYYFLQILGLEKLNTHSAVPGLSRELAYLMEVKIPSIDIQKNIANVLFSIDEKVECNNRINTELESLVKTLYDYWFIQFDFPNKNGKPYKSSNGKMVYNDALKRMIPEGWRTSTIGETFKTHLGGTPSRNIEEYWNPKDINWLSSSENPSTFVVAPDEKMSDHGLQNSAAKLLPRGSVILSIVRHIRASILSIDSATNQSVVGILETDNLKNCFIYPYLVREIPRLMALRTGAQQPHINKGILDSSILVMPDNITLTAYTEKAAPFFLQIQNHLLENHELIQLRNWLLPMLMNGQVTIS
jgi:type I restriction enzyme S subunit